jgi:predicted nucleotidyltransferase
MGLGIKEIIGSKKQTVLDLAKKYGAENIRIFGSVLRGEANENSDVDLLVHFPVADFYKRLDLEDSLEILLGRKVEVISDRGLDKYIGPYILKEAQPL